VGWYLFFGYIRKDTFCLFPGLIAGIVVCICILIGVGVVVFFIRMNKVSGYDII
jgi:hypothetical protein